VTDTEKKTPARKTTTAKTDANQPSASEEAATDTMEEREVSSQVAHDAHLEEQAELTRAANGVVRRNVYWALGFGLVPVPVADMFTIGAVQLKMMKELSDLYGVPFTKNLATAAAAGIVGGIGPVELAKGLSASVAKLIPGVGSTAGIAALPITAGTLTYVIGHVLVKHFETGGTFCNFDASRVKGYSRDLYQKGKGLVGRMKKDKEAEEAEATTAATA